MNRIVVALCLSSLGLSVPAAAATIFAFSNSGYATGGSISGQFTGDDADDNGILDFAAGEITAFTAQFTGNRFVAPFSIGFDSLMQFSYNLDGTLGDDAGDALFSRNAFNSFFVAGVSGICDGVTFCAGVGATPEEGVVTVTLSRQPLIVTEVPEPATWALMIGGLGLTGFALRRRAAARHA